MTKFQALFIKLLRVRCGCSWRAVHSEWQMRYVPKENWWYNSSLIEARKKFPKIFRIHNYETPDGNQLVGMHLCEEAMMFLGEDAEINGWN